MANSFPGMVDGIVKGKSCYLDLIFTQMDVTMMRHCGFHGISEAECLSRDCCWSVDKTVSSHQCVYSVGMWIIIILLIFISCVYLFMFNPFIQRSLQHVSFHRCCAIKTFLLATLVCCQTQGGHIKLFKSIQ